MKLPVRRYFALILIYLKPQWLRTCLMILCLLAGIGFQLAKPQIISIFINTVSTHGPASVLMTAGGLYMLAAFLNQAISVATTCCTEYVTWTATNDAETTQLLWQRLFETRDSTYLVVSHRKAVLQRADYIVVLKNGQIEDEGKLEDLLQRNPEMRKL